MVRGSNGINYSLIPGTLAQNMHVIIIWVVSSPDSTLSGRGLGESLTLHQTKRPAVSRIFSLVELYNEARTYLLTTFLYSKGILSGCIAIKLAEIV